MTRKAIIEKLEQQHLRSDIPDFKVGDTVRVHIRIIEGAKERVQMFTGTVIARKGTGLTETISIHRVAYGEGMERVFLLHSPRIAKIEVIRQGDVRRGKLYYLRGTSGKKAKVKSLMGVARAKGANAQEANAVEAEEFSSEIEITETNSENLESTAASDGTNTK